MKKIGIIIQARINSIRLHGKVLKYLDNKTLIEWVIKRLKKTQIKNIILATGDLKNIAYDEIKAENTENLVVNFINSLDRKKNNCSNIDILRNKFRTIRDE